MAAGLCACNDEYTFVPEYEVKLPTDTTINVTIDASTVYQTIDGFASVSYTHLTLPTILLV